MDKPKQYHAAVLPKAGFAVELWKEDIVEPVARGIRIKTIFAGVCGTDLHLRHGKMTFPMPFVLGHEGIGSIDALGKDMTKDHAGQAVQKGDMVYWNNIAPCHQCYQCTVSQDSTSCTGYDIVYQAGKPTPASYSEMAYLTEGNSFYRISPGVPLEAMIALGCALPTMLQGMDNLGGIKFNSTVVIQGAGALGLAAIFLAKLAGASSIIVIEGQQKRLKMAAEFGATNLIDLSEYADRQSRLKRVRQLTNEDGVDVVIEASGNLAAFEEGPPLLRRNGRYLVVGTWAGVGAAMVNPFELVRKAIRIIGTSYAAPKHYYLTTKLIEKHHAEFPLRDCVTHKFALSEVEDAFKALEKGEVVKAVIKL